MLSQQYTTVLPSPPNPRGNISRQFLLVAHYHERIRYTISRATQDMSLPVVSVSDPLCNARIERLGRLRVEKSNSLFYFFFPLSCLPSVVPSSSRCQGSPRGTFVLPRTEV
jgi:hypothetical protein